MLGAFAAPSMFTSCKTDGLSRDASTLNFAMNHFGVTEGQLKKVISAAL